MGEISWEGDISSKIMRFSRRLNIDKERIGNWLDNFKIDEQKYALKLLEHLKVISKEELREICQKLYKKMLEEN
ncbi:MAG: phosphoribosyltransferase-like protein, partial [Promethearchaeota archaeon]